MEDDVRALKLSKRVRENQEELTVTHLPFQLTPTVIALLKTWSVSIVERRDSSVEERVVIKKRTEVN